MLKLLITVLLSIASSLVYSFDYAYEVDDTNDENHLIFEEDKIHVGGWLGYTAISREDSEYINESSPEFGLYVDSQFNSQWSASGLIHYDPTTKKGRLGHAFISYDMSLYDGLFSVKAGRIRTSLGVWSDYQLNPAIRPTLFLGNAVYPARLEADVATDNGVDFSFHKDNWEILFKYTANSPDDADDFMDRTFGQEADLDEDLGSLLSIAVKWAPFHGLNTVLAFTHSNISDDINASANQIWTSTMYESGKWLMSFDYIRTDAKADVTINALGLHKSYKPALDDTFSYLSYSYTDNVRVYVSHGYHSGNSEFIDYANAAGFKRFIDSKGTATSDPAIRELSNDSSHTSDFGLGFIYNFDSDVVLRGEAHYLKSSGFDRVQESGVRDRHTHFFGLSILKLF